MTNADRAHVRPHTVYGREECGLTGIGKDDGAPELANQWRRGDQDDDNHKEQREQRLSFRNENPFLG